MLPPRTLLIASLLFVPVAAWSDDTEKTAGSILSRFDRGDPGWKVRIESLVTLVKAGPAAVPVLIEALKDLSPSTREFAAQTLAVVADPRSKPALLQALDDPELHIRIYALRALNTLGPFELKDPARQFPREGTSAWMPDYVRSALARSNPPPSEAKRHAVAQYDIASIDSARIGLPAPDFSLADTAGTLYRVSQFRGKKTVIVEFNEGTG